MAHVVNFSPLPTEAVAAQLADVDAEVVSVADVDDPVAACRGAAVAIAAFNPDGAIIDADCCAALADTCRAIVVPATGLDSIDADAARQHGIPVVSARGLNAGAVAEWCVWATVGALRHLSERELRIREGEWQQFGNRQTVAGKRVGIVGVGPIGEGVARRLAGWECELAYWTRTRRDAEWEAERGLQWSELDDLVASADVLVLAVAVAPGTEGLLSAERLATMKPTAVVVNAGRGALVDEAAIVAALREGRLHGYATDVFATEPVAADDPLLEAATIVTPHVAGVTGETVGAILAHTITQANNALEGRPLEGVVA